ncbi:MAG TPA: ABC transporter ATP-binding protein [Planctomycetota bacterium]|nr:ABC transporter ATP-binding protein [Planctomycetota bacterium]
MRPLTLREALAIACLAGRAPLALQLGFVLAQGLLPLLGLFAMQWLVDAVADGLAGRAAGAAAMSRVTGAVVLAAAVALVGNLLRSAATFAGEVHGRRLADAGSARLQEHAARLDLAEYDRAAFHDLLLRAGNEAGVRPVRLVQDLAAFGTALVSLAAMGTVLARVEPWLPLLVGAAAAPIAWARTRHARLRFAWQEAHTGEQRDVGYLGAVLTGRATAKDVRALRLEATFGGRLEALRAVLRRSLARLAAGRARDELLVHTLASLGLFGAYLYLGHTALAGGMTIGGLVLHAQAVQRAQNGVRDGLGAVAAIREDRLFLAPFAALLARAPAIVALPPALEPPAGALAIAARAVGFAYPDTDCSVLHELAFELAPGERVAFVGANGSGKSTLVKLLCRLYDPTTGALHAAGTDLRHFEPRRWRERVAVLLQDQNAFELSLRDNLRLGHAHAVDDDTLWRALEVAGLAERVRALPAALDTPLSRRQRGGVELSGGELRRLVLARALAQPAGLLLLDEPFALLDGIGAEALARELANRSREQTVVVVDHRVAAVRWVDRAFVLAGGRVLASGAPAVLARDEPRFAELFPDW